jgi:hypothetical protein
MRGVSTETLNRRNMPTTKRTLTLGSIPIILIVAAAAVLSCMILSGGMAKVVAWNLLPTLLPTVALSGLILFIVSLFRRKLNPLSKTTGAVALLAMTPALMMFFPVAYPASLADTGPSVTVRLPADVPLKVAWGGDTLAVNQHVVVPDQRWAYDFLVAPYLTGSSKLTDYGCYGIPVVAPAAGTVTVAHDGEPDMIPSESSSNYTAPEGNHVFIRLDETGTYLVIAHLKPGSLTVSAGQHVEAGQVIGQCGNSGNTSEPHIHIHHQRQDPAIYPVNFAEGLPLYFRDLDGPPMPQGGISIINGVVVATGDTVVYQKQP